MNFLDECRWSGKIFTGEWTAPVGGTIPVVEPATGIEVGRVGEASLSDLERSVARAREAQTAWAAVSFTERAAVMRRAADLWTDHADEVHNWLMREAGGIPLKAQYEVFGAVQECLESSELPSHALGEVLPTDRCRSPTDASPTRPISIPVAGSTTGIVPPSGVVHSPVKIFPLHRRSSRKFISLLHSLCVTWSRERSSRTSTS